MAVRQGFAARLTVATTIGGGVLLSPATVFAAADAQADVLPTLAVPQAPPATPAVPADDRPVLPEEVIVTARKREEPLPDVPVSVSAFHADPPDARGKTGRSTGWGKGV